MKVLRLPPALLAGVYVAALIASASMAPASALAFSSLCLAIQLGWAYWLYSACKADRARPAWTLGGRTPFLLTAVGAAMVGATSDGSPIGALGVLAAASGFLASLWMAGRALVRAEGGDDPHANRRVVTFLALMYFPIGVWSLHRRAHALHALSSERPNEAQT